MAHGSSRELHVHAGCCIISRMVDVGVVGASGFTGAELLRLCAQHPELDVRVATGDTQAGTGVATLYPSLGAAYGSLVFSEYDPSALDGLDLVFLGLPHGASQGIVPELVGKIGHLVDLGADFRLQDPGLYPRWYGEAQELRPREPRCADDPDPCHRDMMHSHA